MKRTSFNFMSFYDIEVVSAAPGERIKIGSGSDYIMPELWGESLRRTNEDGYTYFLLLFNSERPLSFEMIAHECWHMFFQIMEYQGESPLSMSELFKELYAMSFETLYGRTLKALAKLGMLKEAMND